MGGVYSSRGRPVNQIGVRRIAPLMAVLAPHPAAGYSFHRQAPHGAAIPAQSSVHGITPGRRGSHRDSESLAQECAGLRSGNDSAGRPPAAARRKNRFALGRNRKGDCHDQEMDLIAGPARRPGPDGAALGFGPRGRVHRRGNPGALLRPLLPSPPLLLLRPSHCRGRAAGVRHPAAGVRRPAPWCGVRAAKHPVIPTTPPPAPFNPGN